MQNGLRVAVDTNILFMFLYKPDSKAGQILRYAAEEKIFLVAPDIVKEELKILLERKFGYDSFKTKQTIEALPIEWYDRELYSEFISKAKLMPHKPDRPLVALALLLNCGILTANYKHFKHVKKALKIWSIDELLEKIKNQ